jgi:hypothetical protein
MSKHTPGPWTLKVGPFGEHSIKAPDKKSVASVLQKRADVEANARLIAAAPELLEVAKACLTAREKFGLADLDLTRTLKAVIEKAEGTSK